MFEFIKKIKNSIKNILHSKEEKKLEERKIWEETDNVDGCEPILEPTPYEKERENLPSDEGTQDSHLKTEVGSDNIGDQLKYPIDEHPVIIDDSQKSQKGESPVIIDDPPKDPITESPNIINQYDYKIPKLHQEIVLNTIYTSAKGKMGNAEIKEMQSVLLDMANFDKNVFNEYWNTIKEESEEKSLSKIMRQTLENDTSKFRTKTDFIDYLGSIEINDADMLKQRDLMITAAKAGVGEEIIKGYNMVTIKPIVIMRGIYNKMNELRIQENAIRDVMVIVKDILNWQGVNIDRIWNDLHPDPEELGDNGFNKVLEPMVGEAKLEKSTDSVDDALNKICDMANRVRKVHYTIPDISFYYHIDHISLLADAIKDSMLQRPVVSETIAPPRQSFIDVLKDYVNKNKKWLKPFAAKHLDLILSKYDFPSDDKYVPKSKKIIRAIELGYGNHLLIYDKDGTNERNEACKYVYNQLSNLDEFEFTDRVDVIHIFTYVLEWNDCDSQYKIAK